MATAKNQLAAAPATSLVLNQDGGSVTIADHVVAKIAGLAVREVEGVHALVPFGAGQAITNLAKGLRGTESRDLGVRVEVGKVEAAVDVRIIVDYGASIPAVATAIRKSVTARVSAMTGLKTKEINLEVVDLWFPDDDAKPEPAPTRVQ